MVLQVLWERDVITQLGASFALLLPPLALLPVFKLFHHSI